MGITSTARRTILAVGAAACAGVAGAAATLAVGARVARLAVEVDAASEQPVRVLRRVTAEGERDRVWLSGDGAAAPGVHSLLFWAAGDPGPHAAPADAGALPPGHAKLGPVLATDGGAVLREVVSVDRGELVGGVAGRMAGWWYAGPEELGYRVEETSYETELGPMDAWIVRPRLPRKRRWAVHVHGRGADPAETLRGVAPLARAGITSLVIRYRNDAGQPAGENGRYGLGLSEARDVDAAVGAALERGAGRVTLFGWSMGGTACLIAAAAGEHRDLIDGIVLDSPGLDWPGLLRAHAALRRVPAPVADLGMRLLAGPLVRSGELAGLDLAALTPEALAETLRVQTLVLASPDDAFVPWHGARRFAELRPDLVQLTRINGADHVRLWNVGPERWERTVQTFVSALPKPAWRGH